MSTLTDAVTAEQSQVAGGAPGCGVACGWDPTLVCVRTNPHGTIGKDVHVGKTTDGTLTQWQPAPPA